ncbi:MAG: nucleoside 2-deoxyribosyltransferase [Anaerolineales bacterium]|nr:nucleoside 2-deoxyribosyltransferase [Anaerolineales bacterium]
MLRNQEKLLTEPGNSIYFAGDLFDHKHLIGNTILADYIERLSDGRYQCYVPQDFEQPTHRGVDIRNVDLKAVMSCDFGLFNFDGADLDSGTVVEFMMAKFLDIPSVILRSDFRSSGDGERGNWNLMADYYSRTEVVEVHSLLWYKELRGEKERVEELIEAYYTRMAAQVIAALDKVGQTAPVENNFPNQTEAVFHWSLQFPGSGFAELCAAEPDYIGKLLARKRAKGLLG